MYSKRTSRRNPFGRGATDCASCAASRRCWGEEPLVGTGFAAQRKLQLERGTALTLPPSPSRVLLIVVSGCLTLRERLPDGRQRVAGFCLPGDLVGLESWTRGGEPYEIRAAMASQVCRFALVRAGLGSGNSAFLERLLVKSAAQIDRAMKPWSGLPATERVAAFMEDFLQRARLKGSAGARQRLPMTRADIGSYLGLAEETVVRALARLKRIHRFEVLGKTIGQCHPRTSPPSASHHNGTVERACRKARPRTTSR